MSKGIITATKEKDVTCLRVTGCTSVFMHINNTYQDRIKFSTNITNILTLHINRYTLFRDEVAIIQRVIRNGKDDKI